MIDFDEALALASAAAKLLGKETVPLGEAAGRVLASPVVARIGSPRSDVSAMDGYAVREADVASLPARLRVVGQSFAGRGFTREILAGECVRIFTGAPVPSGADRVVMQENVRREGDTATFETALGPALHIRPAGGDFRTGDVLLESGRLLDPRAIVAAAAADVAEVDVARQPRVHILGTGDELAQPGTAGSNADSIPESVSFGIAALVTEWGGKVTARKRLRDNLAQLEQAAAEALGQSDIVVVTGGASVGEKDFAKAMFEPAGLELIFSKVAIKPGKPVWLGRAGERLVLGLPGNPTSALVTGRLFLAPLLAAMGGRSIGEALSWRTAPLANPLGECGSRETFHRGRWAGETVEPLPFQDSSAQKALAQADVLIRQRASTPAMAAGERVQVLGF
jgi:molybdopterin molybdotransferase